MDAETASTRKSDIFTRGTDESACMRGCKHGWDDQLNPLPGAAHRLIDLLAAMMQVDMGRPRKIPVQNKSISLCPAPCHELIINRHIVFDQPLNREFRERRVLRLLTHQRSRRFVSH